jgi:hypothetical protein
METTIDGPTRLPVREWMAVIAILLFICTITLSILFARDREPLLEKPQYLSEQEIEIIVEGSVEKPGIYRMHKGDTVKELLEQIQLAPDADLKRIKMGRKLHQGQLIRIPQDKKIKNKPR